MEEPKIPRKKRLSRYYRLFLFFIMVTIEGTMNVSSGLLSSATKEVKKSLNKLSSDNELTNFDFSINYDNNVFDINILINFLLDGYEYTTVDGKVTYTNDPEYVNNDDFKQQVDSYVNNMANNVYRNGMLKNIKDDYEDHIYTEKEKETLRRTSLIIRRKLRKLASYR